jgi:hypothetical protein
MVASSSKSALIIGLASTLIGGGCMQTGPTKRPEVVDCADPKNAEACIECGKDTAHLSCCQHPENCSVINAPTTHVKPNPNQAAKDPQRE